MQRLALKKRFAVVAVGGTFDELHKGHRVLLLKAFEVGERVLVGLCSDRLVESFTKPHATAPYEERLKDLQLFLDRRGLLGRTEIMRLDDPFGVMLSKGCAEALAVSKETERVGVKINEERVRRGLAAVKIVVVDMVPSEDRLPISTTRIRAGEIDTEGKLTKRRNSLADAKKIYSQRR